MRDIYKPFVANDDPDRDIRCQDAMQFAFQDLVEASVAAGWSRGEAIEAIIALAEEGRRGLNARDDAKALLNVLLRMA